MLDKVQSRLDIHQISTRQLARDLEVSPSLLSMVLTGQRTPSKQMYRKFDTWLKTPLSTKVFTPAATYRQFIAEFIALIRNGRRVRADGVKPLSHGAVKLHHQTIKTFFNFVGETCDVPVGWKNPVDGIKVKGSQTQTLEYSDDQIKCMLDAVDGHQDDLLRLRNRAILIVLLNSAVRASELVGMNVDILGSDGRIKVTGKGSKQRIVTVGSSGLEAIKKYLN